MPLPSPYLPGRVLTGFSGGAFALLAPAYSSETVEQGIKGALGSLQQLMVCFGLLFVNVLGKFVSWQVRRQCQGDPQTLSGLCLIPPVVLGVTLAFMPRSPVHLVSKGELIRLLPFTQDCLKKQGSLYFFFEDLILMSMQKLKLSRRAWQTAKQSEPSHPSPWSPRLFI